MTEVLFKGKRRMMWRKFNDPTDWFIKRGWTIVEISSIPVSTDVFGRLFGVTLIRRTWKKRDMLAEFVIEKPFF